MNAYVAGTSDEMMQKNYGTLLGVLPDGSDWKRCLGIAVARYECNHVQLKYPIKIVEHPMEYDKAGISPSCPFQGCIYPDRMSEIRREVHRAFADLVKHEAAWKTKQASKNNQAKSSLPRKRRSA